MEESESKKSPLLEPDLEEPEISAPSGDREEEPAMNEDLEVVDLGEMEEPGVEIAPSAAQGSPAPSAPVEDLSDLLEELHAEPADESLPSLREPVPDFRRSPVAVPPTPERPVPRAASPSPLRPVPEAPIAAPVRPMAPQPRVLEGRISPLDPLGLSSRSPEMPAARVIQVGAVTPGREHEITVPLEMSVEGRKVRLNLKMTLTLSR
jgi:hypothetical protein